ncbi:hypothetical protein BLOT_005399 [Blomia tropicalis]|nr:hypothetical protein BLOT_005399 [Blomia tropicalis]
MNGLPSNRMSLSRLPPSFNMTTKLFNVRLALMVLVLQLLLPSLNSQPNDVLSHEQAVAERGLLDFFLQNSWNDDESTVPLCIYLIGRNGLSCPHASNEKEKEEDVEEEEEGNNLDSICVMAGGINQETAK